MPQSPMSRVGWALAALLAVLTVVAPSVAEAQEGEPLAIVVN